MKFSLHSLHGGIKNIDEIHRRARRAEELGYDGIFLGESQLSSIDSFQTLASCAMITKRVLLGIAVTNIVFRHPTVIAGAAASLNEISKGRAIMGLGTGDGPVYSQGLRATPLKELEEGVKLIRHLVRGNTVPFPPATWASGSRSTHLQRSMFRPKVRKACSLPAATKVMPYFKT